MLAEMLKPGRSDLIQTRRQQFLDDPRMADIVRDVQ